MNLLTSDGLLADHTENSNDCDMIECNGETKTNHVDKSDSDSTGRKETTHTVEREVKKIPPT